MTATNPAGDADQPVTHRMWLKYFPLWELYFGLVVAVTTGYVVLVESSLATKALMVGLLVVLAFWYVLVGRPVMRAETEDWRGPVYLIGALALYLPAVAANSATSVLLAVLCSQAFMLMSTLRAIAAVVVFNVGTVAMAWLRGADLPTLLAGPVPVAVAIIIGSSVIGAFIRMLWRQNEERAQLITQLNDSRAEVARLSHEAGVAAERQRLAGEIHDTVAQGLSSVVMLIQAAEAELDRDVSRAREHLRLATATARDNLAEARALVAALTPSALADSSLTDALGRLVDRFMTETGVRATLDVAGEPGRLSTAVEVVLLRAAQESLTNVRKHAGASMVSVRLEYRPEGVALEVADDGCGFDGPAPSGGYGLDSMRARVEQVSGTLLVTSARGRGTTVRVEITDGRTEVTIQ